MRFLPMMFTAFTVSICFASENDNLCKFVKSDIKKKTIQIAQLQEKVNYSIENNIRVNHIDQSDLYRLTDMLKRENNYYDKFCKGE